MMMETCLKGFRSIHSTISKIWRKQVYYKRLSQILKILLVGKKDEDQSNKSGSKGTYIVHVFIYPFHILHHSIFPSNFLLI